MSVDVTLCTSDINLDFWLSIINNNNKRGLQQTKNLTKFKLKLYKDQVHTASILYNYVVKGGQINHMFAGVLCRIQSTNPSTLPMFLRNAFECRKSEHFEICDVFVFLPYTMINRTRNNLENVCAMMHVLLLLCITCAVLCTVSRALAPGMLTEASQVLQLMVTSGRRRVELVKVNNE